MAVGTDTRVTYRRRKSYNTRSNKIRKFVTPGSKVQIHYLEKKAKGPQCGDCKKTLQGIPRLRPTQYALIKKSQRTVSRAYGGCLCAPCTKSRVLRAFLSEENKLVKAAQALRAKEAAKAKKATKKADAKKSKKKVKA